MESVARGEHGKFCVGVYRDAAGKQAGSPPKWLRLETKEIHCQVCESPTRSCNDVKERKPQIPMS